MPYPISITPRRMTTTEAQQAVALFPQYNTATAWVIGDATPVYNCLAWTVGITNAWLWPWNPATPVSVAQFNTLYRSYGYDPVTTGAEIAAYGFSTSDMTHGAVYLNVTQSPSGGSPIGNTWTSKLGQWLLVTHTLADLAGTGSSYGNVQQYYAQGTTSTLSSALAPKGTGTMNALSTYELDVIKKHVAGVHAALKKEFHDKYAAWERTWSEPKILVSDNPAARAASPEFYALINLGQGIVPLLMEKLLLPDQFFALQAVERLTAPGVVFYPQMGDVAVLGGEQLRAHETLKRWVLIQHP